MNSVNADLSQKFLEAYEKHYEEGVMNDWTTFPVNKLHVAITVCQRIVLKCLPKNDGLTPFERLKQLNLCVVERMNSLGEVEVKLVKAM